MHFNFVMWMMVKEENSILDSKIATATTTITFQ